ncbi:MAG: LiaF transmembrane domain-containing protein [Flavobacteriales bacterium]
MTAEEIKNEEKEMDTYYQEWEKSHKRGRISGGLLVITAGSLFLAREMGVMIPDWVFTWKTLLVAIGLHALVKHGFRRFFWVPFIVVGTVFLICQDFVPGTEVTKYLWPLAIIIIGLFIVFKPRKRCKPGAWHNDHWKHHRRWKQYEGWKGENNKRFQYSEESASPEDYVNARIIFSGVKKNIISKDFKGGDIEIVFGGAEINLSQADIQQKAEIQISQVFGGIKLIVPPHWKIQSELETIMAGMEDKRYTQNNVVSDDDKILVLKGSIVFGGIEIKSY